MSRLDQPSRGAFGAPGLGMLGLMVALWLGWGTAYPAMGIALLRVDPLTLRCALMLVAGALLLAYGGLTGGRLAIPRALWRDFAICALGTMTVCQIGMTYGVYFVGAGRSSVLIYTMPIWAALLARGVLGEPITARRTVALALAAASIAALLAQSLPQVRNAPLGVVANLIGALGFALGTVWTKRTAWPIDPTAMAGWQFIIGALPLLAVWLLLGAPHDLSRVDGVAVAAFAYMAVVANAVSYVVWFRLVRRLPTAVAGVGSLVVPCVGVLGSALLADEAIQPNDLLALALVCAALGLVLFEAPGRTVRDVP